MEQINYEKYLEALTPPKDLVEWTIKHNGFPKEYLIYKAGWQYNPLEERNEPAVEVVCTCCGKKFIAQKVDTGGCHHCYPTAPFGWFNPMLTEATGSGSDTKCPACGANAESVHIGRCGYGIDKYSFVTQLVRIPVPGVTDRLALIEWRIGQHIEKDGKKSYGQVLWEAYVVEERKVVRLKNWQRMMSTIYLTGITQKRSFLDDYGEMMRMYPFEESVLYGTTAENCKIDRFIKQGGRYLVAYLAVWRKKPNMENLIMQGCTRLVDELIEEDQHHGTYSRNKGIPGLRDINWKEKQPHRMLNLSKEEFREYGKKINAKDYHRINIVRGVGIPLNIGKQLPILRRHGEWEIEHIIEEQPLELFWKILQYIDDHRISPGRDYHTLRDYWSMAQVLGEDLTNARVRWPKDLKAAHDRVTAAYNKRKTQINKQRFVDRLAQLERFAWSCDGILIRPCATQEEMKREGKLLNHCVARYAEDHAAGKTAIFFIRQESDPDKPFYTLEWDELNCRVKQNRGKWNCAKTPEVEEFEKKWVAWATEQTALLLAGTTRRKSA